MNFTYEYSFLERGNKFIGVGYKTGGETCVEITFDQCYPAFLVRYSSRDVAISTLLSIFFTLKEWSRARTFGSQNEIDKKLLNFHTQLLT